MVTSFLSVQEKNGMKERLKVEHLSVSFFTDEGEVQAVRDVSFSLNAGDFEVLSHCPAEPQR